jgi:hypothetical protein
MEARRRREAQARVARFVDTPAVRVNRPAAGPGGALNPQLQNRDYCLNRDSVQSTHNRDCNRRYPGGPAQVGRGA